MKSTIKFLLQRLLGYRRYLRLFAYFKIKTLHQDPRERDFLFFVSMLPDSGTVLDIGANLGFLTYYLSTHVKNGNVIAFEPMPDNLDALRSVVRIFRLTNVRVEDCALGDVDGDAEMILPLFGKSREQGLSHMLHEQLTENNNGVRFTVAVRRLDGLSYLFEPDVRVTGIKMDVENFEQFVLKGARRLLEVHQPLIYIELMNNDNRRRCFEIAKNSGYKVMVREGSELTAFEPARHEDRINMFMVPA